MSTALQGWANRRGRMRTSTEAAFAKVTKEVGEIDVLVNNAGITRDGVFRKMSRES